MAAPRGSAAWQRRVAAPRGSAEWQRRMAAPHGSMIVISTGIIYQCPHLKRA